MLYNSEGFRDVCMYQKLGLAKWSLLYWYLNLDLLLGNTELVKAGFVGSRYWELI